MTEIPIFQFAKITLLLYISNLNFYTKKQDTLLSHVFLKKIP